MECSFEENTTSKGGGYRSSTCMNNAEVLIIGDSCYGLCFSCAYKKLQAENKKYRKVIEEI